jgi:DNA-binding response OmpR family regulator
MRIAIVEDDPDSARLLGRLFTQDGASPELYRHGQQFLRHASLEKFDLALVDLQLPDMSGLQVLERLRALEQTSCHRLPVIIVTGCAETAVMAAAFAGGAIDYVLKPFQPAELLVRAKAIAQRMQPSVHQEAPIEVGGIWLNLATLEARVDGQEVRLSEKEFRLAWLLFRRVGEPVSRTQLLRVVWGQMDARQSRTLDTHVGRLKIKLGLAARPRLRLRPVYGIGYRLDVFS